MANWTNLPQNLLKIFETQQHALDNCAAACACSAWRCAVNCSDIRSLHLHANGMHNRDWDTFLSSRLFLSRLQISRQRELACLDESWIHHIPLACRSLVFDDFPEDIHLVTDCLTQLQQLNIGSCADHSSGSRRLYVPSLMHLTQLSPLHLKGLGLECCLEGFPVSVKQLCVNAINYTAMSHGLQQTLLQLTGLELRNMYFSSMFAGSGLTCLQNLGSLSLQDTTIWASPTQLQDLTLLTHLNLSGSQWMIGAKHVEAPSVAVFKAWPLLRILKAAQCNLFGAETRLEAPRVLDLHISYKIKRHFFSQVRWTVTDPSAIQSPIPDYCCLDYLVELHVTVIGSAAASEVLCRALSNFQFLEALHLHSFGLGCDGAAEFIVTDHEGQTLKELELNKSLSAHWIYTVQQG